MERGRIIGRYGGARRGPVLVVVAGLHGNEPDGVTAAGRVLAALERRRPALRGEVWAIAGNLAALEAGRRLVDEDLNRIWNPGAAGGDGAGAGIARSSEERERRALLAAFRDVSPTNGAPPFHVLDLHTASGGGPPSTVLADTLPNRRLARALPIPMVLGLEEAVPGSLLGFLADRGHPGLAVEGGRTGDEETPLGLEAAIWCVLHAAGLADARHVPGGLARQRTRLLALAPDLPPIVEVRYRHVIAPPDGFAMEPGHVGFEPVTRGQPLGRDRNGPVAAPSAGRLLLPLYQPVGEDGFFLTREVRPLWLGLSAVLRRIGAWRLAPWLPGIRALKGRARRVSVNRRVARFLPVEVLHLLGYRRTDRGRAPDGRMTFAHRGGRG